MFIAVRQPIFVETVQMKCIVLADDPGWEELFEGKQALVELVELSSREEFFQFPADAYFDLRDEAWDLPAYPQDSTKPVFISAVSGTLSGHHSPENFIRINAWPGMLKRERMECVASQKIQPDGERILGMLNKQVEWLPDTPGMVLPRVLSMIINEAWFAWGEGVSSKDDIDTAMQLGTNYPLGPFAWGEKIGLDRICRLLSVLSSDDERYQIAPALFKEVGL
jgi:3-hydroxybutyryl-CoA dehydrogenase